MGEFIPNLLLVFLQILFQMVLNFFQSGEVSPVGGVTIYFGSLREVSGLRGGEALEDTMVAPVGPGSNTQGNL